MPERSCWEHINVPLPPLTYATITQTGAQEKGSTTWAAYSSTPARVVLWAEFDDLIVAESGLPRSKLLIDSQFEQELERLARKRLFRQEVRTEEDVTDLLTLALMEFSDEGHGSLSRSVVFRKSSQYIKANPDIIAETGDSNVWGSGPVGEIKSPENKSAQRRSIAAAAQKLYLFPFETKPSWKFPFLMASSSHQVLIDEWEVPEDFDPPASMRADRDALPRNWSAKKKKVFHVIRQLYGQMESANRRYGILQTYECWCFCKRTENGDFMVSRVFKREDSSPSVFQAIRTLIFLDNHELNRSQVHPKNAPPRKKIKKDEDGSDPTKGSGTAMAGNSRDAGDGREEGSGICNLATTLHLSDCVLYDTTDTVQLLTTTTDASVLVKLQRDPQMMHVAREMENEAVMYTALAKLPGLVGDVIPRYYGFSRHRGVAMSCFSRELDDFDDIGVENLSKSLKESAVECVAALSAAGVLHKDIALRNFVQSRDNPARAKVIDLGRSTFSQNQAALAEQVDNARSLLHLD